MTFDKGAQIIFNIPVSGSELTRASPMMPTLREQALAFGRAPRSSCVFLEPLLPAVFPVFKDRRYQLPRGLRLIPTDKERTVANHRIKDEALVGLGRI